MPCPRKKKEQHEIVKKTEWNNRQPLGKRSRNVKPGSQKTSNERVLHLNIWNSCFFKQNRKKYVEGSLSSPSRIYVTRHTSPLPLGLGWHHNLCLHKKKRKRMLDYSVRHNGNRTISLKYRSSVQSG